MPEVITTWTRPIAEALLNGFWQGLLLALAATLFLRLNRRAGAAARYAVWYLTLIAILGLPVLHVLQSQRATAPEVVERLAVSIPSALPVAAAPLPQNPKPLITLPLEIQASSFTAFAVLFWIVSAAWLCLRLARACRSLARLKLSSRPLRPVHDAWWRRWLLAAPSIREPALRTSDRVPLPLTAGLTKPMVLFPERLLGSLTEEEARAIWLHELAHIQRLDDWSKLGQRFAEAILFFHPAVYWIARRLEFEREIACDDWVVRQMGEAKPYAACLAKLAEYSAGEPVSMLAPAMATDRKQIFRRVRMLITKNKKKNETESRASGILAVAATLAVALTLAVTDPVLVLAQEAPAPPAPPAKIGAPPAPPAAVAMPAPPAGSGPSVVPLMAGAPAGPYGMPPPPPPAPPELAIARPAPPAPPAFQEPSPAPKPAPAPNPVPAPSPEIDVKLQEELMAVHVEMQKHQAELRELSQEIRAEVEKNVHPQMHEIRELSQQIRAEVEREIRPHVNEIRELHEQLVLERSSELPNEEKVREFERKIREMEESFRPSEARIRELEKQIRDMEIEFRPNEENMRKFEEKMREVELQFQEKVERMVELERERRERGHPAKEEEI